MLNASQTFSAGLRQSPAVSCSMLAASKWLDTFRNASRAARDHWSFASQPHLHARKYPFFSRWWSFRFEKVAKFAVRRISRPFALGVLRPWYMMAVGRP